MGVGSTHDPLERFPGAATWSWDEQANKMPDDPRIESLDADAIIREVAAEEFARRGYTEVERDTGDVWLHSELGVATWMSQTSATGIGSLSLTLVEAASGRGVWVGSGGPTPTSLSTARSVCALSQGDTELLKTFPPGQPG
jgi:hypothetical protein